MDASIVARIDQIFSRWAKNDSPGCTLAVIRKGQIAYSQGYGLANLEYRIPNQPNTIFHIASVSKQFACMAILLLEADGKLSIDDDYRNYLPAMPDFGHRITIRHLMHHTSGIRDQWELLQLAGWRMDDVIKTDDIEYILKRQTELNFVPGERYTYCNSGYTLLALIVKAVSGKTLREFCDERIFKPLAMHDTHFHDDHTMLVPGRAYSYDQKADGHFVNEVLSYATVGATSLFTTVLDLAKWHNNFDQPVVGDRKLIKRMLQTTPLNDGKPNTYALGLMIGSYGGAKVVEHSGGDAGYRTHFLRMPEHDLGIIIFCNLGNMNPGSLACQVADVVLEGKLKTTAAAKAEPANYTKSALKPFTGTYYHPVEQTYFKFGIKDGNLIFDLQKAFGFDSYADQRFKLKAMPIVEIQFSSDGDQVWLMPKNPEGVFTKVTATAPNLKTLKGYCGSYYSPELDVTYEVSMNGRQLVMERLKYPPLPLHFAQDTTFLCDLSQTLDFPATHVISFFGDQDTGIHGFLLNSGRVKNVRFIRK